MRRLLHETKHSLAISFLPQIAACDRAAPTEAQHGLTALEKEEESTIRTGAPLWIFPLHQHYPLATINPPSGHLSLNPCRVILHPVTHVMIFFNTQLINNLICVATNVFLKKKDKIIYYEFIFWCFCFLFFLVLIFSMSSSILS